MTAKREDLSERDQILVQAYYDGELWWLARWCFERRLQESPSLQRALQAWVDIGDRLREADALAPTPDLWEQIERSLPRTGARGSAAERRAPWLMRPAAALALAASVALIAVGVLWPKARESGDVVHWIDAGGRSLLVLDDVSGTTIIWVLDGGTDDRPQGGGSDVV
jgi:ferric-dicitrate binding protein FerR (iron transport regulator)